MSSNLPSLDDLFVEARKQLAKERATAKPKTPRPEVIEPQGLFANPDNWVQIRGVALIHRETQTLLGNFWELRHKSVTDARRLVRSSVPIRVEAVEEVDFGLSLPEPQGPISPRAETVVRWQGPISLETPPVSAPSIQLDVTFFQGWTIAARLVEPSVFAEEGELLMLPAGVNILPVMTREGKKALREAFIS